jgi:hypothetical protein
MLRAERFVARDAKGKRCSLKDALTKSLSLGQLVENEGSEAR